MSQGGYRDRRGAMRVEYAGAIYDVMDRGDRWEDILDDFTVAGTGSGAITLGANLGSPTWRR